jgi:predicted RNA binding protein YcfA (HicA-like mRNA interferase family)
MKIYSPEEIIRFLGNQGWIIDRQKWSHCVMYHPISKKRTIVALHKKDLPIGTLLAILRQTWFNKDDLENI